MVVAEAGARSWPRSRELGRVGWVAADLADCPWLRASRALVMHRLGWPFGRVLAWLSWRVVVGARARSVSSKGEKREERA